MTSPLTDLDELVLKCRDERAKSYLREAVVSYRAGAFRAAVVATWIAVCFDFIEKLQELSLAGDQEAEKQIVELEKIRSSSDVSRALKFEKDLLIIAREKFELISPLEFIDLQRLQEDRNRCAHPSLVAEGQAYSPSAELARLHISAAVTSLLQHAPAQGKYALDRLVKDVESDYFPSKTNEAKDVLSSGPLKKPRDSLVRNFVVVLLKIYLLEKSDYKRRSRISAALRATSILHPALFASTLGEKLSPILRQVDDAELMTTLNFFGEVKDCWQFVGVDVKQKLINFVSNLPAKFFDDIELALRIPELKPSAETRIKRATRKELTEAFFFSVPEPVVNRYIDIYLSSSSYDQANSWAKQMIANVEDFSADQARRILENVTGNGQVLGSFELGSLINVLRKHKILPQEEFDNLLRSNGLEDFIEEPEEDF